MIPRAAYQHILHNSASQNFIRLNIGDKDAFYSSKQVSTPLLCNSCEDLFSKHGETGMGMLWSTQAGFPLRDKIRSYTPITNGNYSGDSLDERDRKTLIYFAASILWRANIWPIKMDSYKGSLGKKYAEQFRKFLLNEAPLSNFKMVIAINSDDDHQSSNLILMLPSVQKNDMETIHSFTVLGLEFNIFLGRSSREVSNAFSILPSNLLLLLRDQKKTRKYNDLAGFSQNIVTMRGKLAKDYPKR